MIIDKHISGIKSLDYFLLPAKMISEYLPERASLIEYIIPNLQNSNKLYAMINEEWSGREVPI
jgi:hypothetical protein